MISKAESPLSKKADYELFLLSTLIFVLSALLLRFLMTLQTAILLKYYSISFIYSLFDINFTSVSVTKWNSSMIYMVYGVGLLIFFIFGIVLLRIKVRNWKIRLALSWLAFLMIHTLPLGMLAGIYFFDEFGTAYTWLFKNIIVRILIAFAVLLIAIYFRPFWIFRFLKTAYSTMYLASEKNRRKYIKYCFILPWCAGTIIVSVFALPHLIWVWFVFIFGLGAVVLTGFRKAIPAPVMLIHKTDKKILPFGHPLLYFIALIVTGAIWLVSLIRISF